MLRTAAVGIALSGLLLWGCTPPQSGDTESPGTGGGVSTGRATGGASGGSAGSGGAPGTGGSPASGTGGTASGTGGTPAGTGGTQAGTGGTTPAPDAGSTSDTGPAVDPGPGGGFAPCPKCKSIFDGKTLDGWLQDPAGSFEVKEGAIASTGKGAHAWTKDDYGDFRIFFDVRQIKGNHKPCTTLFNTRPANGKAARGLNGIQFQPPMGGSWDYRPGKNSGPNATNWMYPNPRPQFDVLKWHRCEIVAKASTGEFKGACCEIEGKDSCKGQVVLTYKDATAGKKGPFSLMMHNGGLFDEFKNFWIETDPTEFELLSTK